MYVSVETITIVLSAIGIVVTLGGSIFAGMAWLVRRMDAIETRAVARADRTDGRLDMLRAELTSQMGELRTEFKSDIAELRAEFKSDIAELRAEFKSDIAELRAELKSDSAELRTELGGVKHELVELKVSVARWEGPPLRLAMAR